MAANAVILANLGTPRAPDPAAVGEFLTEFLLDPFVVDLPRWLWRPLLRYVVVPRRAPVSVRLYREVWTEAGSPLDVGTREIARALGVRLGPTRPVEIAYRYGAPSVKDALVRAAASGGVAHLVSLFPQRTGSTTGTLTALVREQARNAGTDDRLRIVQLPPDAPGYIEALADTLRRALSGAFPGPQHVVISFHGIPARYDRREGGVYRADCEATARAMLRAAGWPQERAVLCYQSRFGPGAWLGPSTASVLADAPRRGIRNIVVVTPGFLTEGLETVEEIGVQGRETFLRAGGESFVRVPPVESHPAFIEELALRLAASR